MRIRVGHSPDPDDAFMFHASGTTRSTPGTCSSSTSLQDIETLNRRAFEERRSLRRSRIHAYAHLLDTASPSGCSMGDKYGPMVVARGR